MYSILRYSACYIVLISLVNTMWYGKEALLKSCVITFYINFSFDFKLIFFIHHLNDLIFVFLYPIVFLNRDKSKLL